jgi:hypothetical protein
MHRLRFRELNRTPQLERSRSRKRRGTERASNSLMKCRYSSRTVLPHRSRALMLAFQSSSSRTTSPCPSQAAMCSAVRPSRSMLSTSTPPLSSSSTPAASPWHAAKSSRMVASRFSGTASCWCADDPSGPPRGVGSSDDCLAIANRVGPAPAPGPPRRGVCGSSDSWRHSRAAPDESCREMPRVIFFAAASIARSRRPPPEATTAGGGGNPRGDGARGISRDRERGGCFWGLGSDDWAWAMLCPHE